MAPPLRSLAMMASGNNETAARSFQPGKGHHAVVGPQGNTSAAEVRPQLRKTLVAKRKSSKGINS